MRGHDTMANVLVQESDILGVVPHAIAWMESLGISAAKSRYARYERHVARFFDADIDPASSEGRKEWRNLSYTYRECIDIYSIFGSFSECNHPNFVSILKKVASGEDVPEAARAGMSRDFAFELLIAAKFRMAGYAIQFDGTSDVVADRAGVRVRAECKRLTSEKKLVARLKEAGSQLSSVISPEEGKTLGLIFVDVSSCIGQDVPQLVPTAADAENALQAAMNKFLYRNRLAIETLNDRFANVSYATCVTATAPIWSRDLVLHAATGTRVCASRSISEPRFARLEHALASFSSGLPPLLGRAAGGAVNPRESRAPTL